MAALVVAVLSLGIPVVGGGVAIVIGLVALVHIARSSGSRIGRGMAWSSIALGVLTAAGWVALIGSGVLERTLETGPEQFMRGMGELMEDEIEAMQVSSQVTVGECVDLSLGTVAAPLAVTADDVVACDGDHDAEYLGSVEATGDRDADWPGDDELYDRYAPDCVIRLEEEVGEAYDMVTLEVLGLYPDRAGWLLGDREVACFVVDPAGQPLTQHVTGDEDLDDKYWLGLDPTQLASELAIGDCLELDLEAPGGLDVTSDDVVACGDEHTAEYLGSVEVPGGRDAEWPGEDELVDDHWPDCIDHFEEAIGRDYDIVVDLDVFLLYAGEEAWEVGDREVACFVVGVDGQPLTEHVTGN